MLDAAVVSSSLGASGLVAAMAASISAMVGTMTSWTVIHSGLTSTYVERIPMRTSGVKARTVLSAGVERVKEGVKYCTPQRTWMCGSGVARHMSRRFRSVSGTTKIHSNYDLGDIP